MAAAVFFFAFRRSEIFESGAGPYRLQFESELLEYESDDQELGMYTQGPPVIHLRLK